MEIVFLEQAKADIEYWKKSGNKKVMTRISVLLEDILKHPYTGLGKPEQLRFALSGFWSRRINSEHRIIYKVMEDKLVVYILAMRYHYSR